LKSFDAENRGVKNGKLNFFSDYFLMFKVLQINKIKGISQF